MKRNLFEVDSNEIKRILNLHEERSKKQYLNIISEGAAKGTWDNPYTDADLQPVVDDLVNELDGGTYEGDLKEIKATLEKYIGKVAIDDSDYYNPKKLSAIYRIRQLYFRDENETFIDDVNSVFDGGGQVDTLKKNIVSILKNYNKNVPKGPTEKPTNVVTKDHKFGSIYVPAKSTFNRYNNQYVIIKTPKGDVWYDCDTQTYSTGGAYIKGDGALEYLLNKSVKGCNRNTPPKVAPPKSNAEREAEALRKAEEQKQAEEQKKAEEQQLLQQQQQAELSKLTPKQQQFYTNTTNYINQVQKELGMTETGKLTNGDIDTLITKLKTK